MQFRENSPVYDNNDRDLGRIARVVMDPVTNKVTHVVIRQGLIFTEDKVIPVEYFRSATPERATLREDIGDLDSLPVFEETHYVPAEYADDVAGAPDAPDNPMPSIYWNPPMGMSAQHTIGFYGTPAYAMTMEGAYTDRQYVKWTEQNIPENTVAVKEGAEVISADDEHVGDIEQIHVDMESNYATHVLVSQGLLMKEKKWIPTLWFRRVEEDKVYLAVTASLLETLPEAETA